MTVLVVVAAAALVTSFVATPLMVWVSRRAGIIDIPNERSSHAIPTPRSGGVAILLGAFAPFLVLSRPSQEWWIVIGAVLLVALVGFIDDLRSIGVVLRFSVHAFAALLAIWGAHLTIHWVDLPWDGALSTGIASIPLTLFFCVGMTNAFNFMDGINGIASLQATVAGGVLAALFLQCGDQTAAIIALAVAAAAAGFLPWNFPKAAMFMGDVGSGALGMAFGLLIVRYSVDTRMIVPAVLPLLPFIADTSVTFVRRALRGERVYTAHRTHFYQRLNTLGWSHAAVTAVWTGMAVISGFVAIVYSECPPMIRTLLVTLVLLLHAALAISITLTEGHRAAGPRQSSH